MARHKNSGQVYVARESGHVEIKGVPYVFHNGRTRVREGHPLTTMGGFDLFFEPADGHVHYDVEQATDAPNERRDVMLGSASGSIGDMTVTELRDAARERGVTPGSMSKAELIEAIEDAGV